MLTEIINPTNGTDMEKSCSSYEGLLNYIGLLLHRKGVDLKSTVDIENNVGEEDFLTNQGFTQKTALARDRFGS